MIRATLGFVGLALAGPLAAQDATPAPEPLPWRVNYFPYLIGNATTGAMLIGHFDYSRQADYFARVPYDGILSVEGGVSAQGSRFLEARFRAPGLRPGWRLAADAGASRESRFGYGTAVAPDADDAAYNHEHFDRVHRTRYFARGEITRRIAGPLALAAMGGLERTVWSRLPGVTAFSEDYGDDLTQTGAVGRLSLILDLRDREFLTTRGVLLETGVVVGGGGEDRDGDLISQGASSGWYAHLRGYVSPRSGTLVAARIAARSLSDEATLQAQHTLPGWEGDTDALGGPASHRSFIPGSRFGHGLLLGSFEVRHNLLDVGDYGAVTLIGFVDGGRVFAKDAFALTAEGWSVGGGGGVALRVLRTSLLAFNFAGGDDGFRFSMATHWAF